MIFLYLEDLEHIGTNFKEELEFEHGHTVHWCATVAEAIQIMQQVDRIDLAIIDVDLEQGGDSNQFIRNNLGKTPYVRLTNKLESEIPPNVRGLEVIDKLTELVDLVPMLEAHVRSRDVSP